MFFSKPVVLVFEDRAKGYRGFDRCARIIGWYCYVGRDVYVWAFKVGYNETSQGGAGREAPALFSKLSRNITVVAAKEGGDLNPDNNASLCAAIEKAKGYSLPKDKIKVAIDKAFGSGKDSTNYETVVHEGYGPAGVAVLCEALTDNRNRTAADVRAAFSHAGGNLGTSGSVAFQFERKGQIMVPKEVETGDKKNPVKPNGAAADEEEFMLAVAEAGGDDYEDAEDEWIVYTSPTDLMAVKKALEEADVVTKGAEMTMVPTTPATVSVSDAKKVMRLVDRLEELEDLQNVYHVMDITDEIAEAGLDE